MFQRVAESPRMRPLREHVRWLWNVVRFGRDAPRPNERIWVRPADVRHTLDGLPVRSGYVVDAWPASKLAPFEEHAHVRFALAHWRDGVPWDETGAYEYMLERIEARGRQDGCFDLADVQRRYRRLDDLYETARRERRLRTRTELEGASDEDGGILVHVGPGGEPAVGDSGKHRLTIAKLLELELVPARIGYVHRDALRHLGSLRRDARRESGST